MAFKAGTILLCGAALAAPTVVMAADGERFDPYATIRTEPYYIDMQEIGRASCRERVCLYV